MEALAVVSLVGNVLQFLDFASELITKSTQIYQSRNGAAANITDTETVTVHLRQLSTRLKDATHSNVDNGLGNLCQSCQSVADELLSALAKVKAQSKTSKWESIRKALRTIWSKNEIKELEQRLAGLRAELNLHITADIKDQIHQLKLDNSTGLDSLDSKTSKIIDAIEGHHGDISNALQSQRQIMSEVLDVMNRAALAGTQPVNLTVPSSNVPFRRDVDFVDRPQILNKIRERFSEPAGRAALVGLGGVGKSQLAIEYSYELGDIEPSTWIFWVHAGSIARFEEGYRAIAEKVKLPDREKPKVDILRLVYDWLCSKDSGMWLLILDNADDASIFFHSHTVSTLKAPESGRKESFSGPPLSTYLPQSQNGSILITTRVEDAAFKLTGSYNSVIKVEGLDHDQAMLLLQTKLGSMSAEADSGELVEALDCIPLAISQAAAYIRQRAPRSSISKYLVEFRKNERRKTALLDHDAGDLRRDPSASGSITITWSLSFDHIRATKPSAAELLSLMSYYDQQDIPEYLVRGNTLQKPVTTSGAGADDDLTNFSSDTEDEDDDEDTFEDDVAMLRNYSLIGIIKNGDAFKMHSLVQLSTRKWLEDHGQSEKWKAQFVSNLSQVFPSPEFSNWNRCQELFAHAEAARRQPPTDPAALENWASILQNAGAYAMAQGNFSVAARMTEKAVSSRVKVLGSEHPSTLATNCTLALVRRYQGKYDDAEVISRQVLAGRERTLGPNHLETLTSVNNLGAVLRYQGKYTESEDLNRRVYAERKRTLGVEHKETLASLNNLAMILRYQGKYEQSEVFIREALQGTEKSLGKQHPETLRNLSKLATVLQKQGKYEDSEAMQRRAIEGYSEVLGKQHPDTITGISKLAIVLGDLGKFDEARERMRQVLATRERILGKDHPSTLASAGNLASLLQSSGNYIEAERIGRRALERRELLLGKEHPDSLTSVHMLATTLHALNRAEEAEVLHLQAFRGRENALGPDHPDTITTIFSLACLQHEQKRYEDASRLYERATISYEATLGAQHPKTLTCKRKHESMVEEGTTISAQIQSQAQAPTPGIGDPF